jgi:hypothetical protein
MCMTGAVTGGMPAGAHAGTPAAAEVLHSAAQEALPALPARRAAAGQPSLLGTTPRQPGTPGSGRLEASQVSWLPQPEVSGVREYGVCSEHACVCLCRL